MIEGKSAARQHLLVAKTAAFSLAIALSLSLSTTACPQSALAADTSTDTGTTTVNTAATTTITATTSKAPSDEGILRGQVDDYIRAYTAADAGALAAMWTEDGLFTDSSGNIHKGRPGIEDYFKQGFAKSRNNSGATLEVSDLSFKFPAPGVAIEEGTTRVKGGPDDGSLGRYLVVHVKQNGQWLMQSAAETACRQERPANNLKDLDWLVGSWSCKSDKGTLHMRADWSKNKTFMVCRYFGGEANPSIEELEIIGWDPVRSIIRTWHFDARGGFGNGRFLNNGKRWDERASGIEADGTADSGIYTLTNVDNNTFTWQSSRRFVAGHRLPDAGVMTITRDSKL